MLIEWTNKAVVRVVGDIRWDGENGRIAEVSDPVLASNLLIAHDGFAVAANEPLLNITTADNVGLLAAYGDIATVAELAAVKPARAKKIAKAAGIPVADVLEWVGVAAHNLLDDDSPYRAQENG